MLRIAGLVLLLAASACTFAPGAASATDPDAQPSIDSSTPGCHSFASQLDTCLLTPSSESLTLLGDHTYNTSLGTLSNGTSNVAITRMQLTGKAGPLEVLIVDNFRMTANARLRATGSVPLAILAFGTITIDGNARIDVSDGGAGARTTCAGGAIAGMPNAGGAGGGGGGGFAAIGGAGGNGDGDGSLTPGGPGGGATSAQPLGPLGGCPGAAGGNGDDDGGRGGNAGGAIYLVSAMRIELAPGSGLNAGGGGGVGGDAAFASNGDAGGGGGGSGGMIMIEAPIVRVAGTLAANGGGGGEASGGGGDGDNGDPGSLATSQAAGGSNGSSTGTNGADGGAYAAPIGGSVIDIDNGGGGGGGGSVGYIVIRSADAMVSTASPDPS